MFIVFGGPSLCPFNWKAIENTTASLGGVNVRGAGMKNLPSCLPVLTPYAQCRGTPRGAGFSGCLALGCTQFAFLDFFPRAEVLDEVSDCHLGEKSIEKEPRH